jgi:hypothetical protein
MAEMMMRTMTAVISLPISYFLLLSFHYITAVSELEKWRYPRRGKGKVVLVLN